MPVISIFLGIKIMMTTPLTFTLATLDSMHLSTFVADAS